MIKKLAAFSLLLTTTACLGSSTPPPTIYTLRPAKEITQSCKINSSLRISSPISEQAIDSKRIAILQDGGKFDYYTGAKWAASPSEMMQSILVDAFEQSGALKSVSSDEESISADYILLTDIRDYEVKNSAAPEVKIKLVTKLISAKDRKVIADIPIEKSITPDANKMEAIVAAFNRGSTDAASDIVQKSKAALKGCK